MNTASASPAESSAASPAAPASRRIIDAPTRVVHWLLAFSFTGAYLTAESERWHLLHITLGYTVLGLIVWRIVWGLIGPRRSRLSALTSKLRSLPTQVRAWLQGKGNALASQQLLNAAAVLGLIAAALLVSASGLLMEQELLGAWAEDLLEELHEGAGNFMLLLVLGHLALIALASVLKRQNAAMTMISGRMPGRGPDLVKSNLGWLAAVIVAAVLGFWAWQWQTAPGDGGTLDGRPLISGKRDHHRDRDDD